MLYLIILIFGIVFFTSFIPICQYLYYKFIKKEPMSLKFYFSEELFDRHMKKDIGLNNVISNREEMQRLWNLEMLHKLP